MPVASPTAETSRIYECTVLYPYPLSQKEEQEVLSEVERLFEDAEAKLVAKDPWGRRGLAYEIKGYKEGNFVVYHYELVPERVREIDQGLRILKGVLRHLIVKPPKRYEISRFSEKYEQWLKEREIAEEQKKHEEEERLKKQVVERVKQGTRKSEQRLAVGGVQEKELTEQIEKIISDKDLNL